jgi:methylated-DNA-[protein]-cysteine S-methyltransferase
LKEIPFGQTRSYLDLARTIGSPKAYRAVGAANGKNPLSIIVPCHRVIGADGTLTGFAGGLEKKAALLAFEARSVRSWQPEREQAFTALVGATGQLPLPLPRNFSTEQR